MSHVYLSRAIRFPVRNCGVKIIDDNGRTIATAEDIFKAVALVAIINLAQPAAIAHDAGYDTAEAMKADIFNNHIRNSEKYDEQYGEISA